MICKGKLYKSGASTAAYMIREKDGERVEVGQVRGFASEDISEALSSVDVMAKATRGEKPVFHTSVRLPGGEQLTPEQWEYVADRIEAKLGLSVQPRAIAFHIEEETGDRHMHVAWSRIDDETMTLREVPFFKLRLKEVSRELENELGITQVRNERADKARAATDDEAEQGRRLGNNVEAIRSTIRDCWDRSDSGRSFRAALEYQDLHLTRGDQRDFIVIDSEGGIHALGKRLLGVSAADIRARCADLDRENLPNVEQARHEQKTGIRDEHAANLAWEDALASAAIQKEKIAGQFAEPFSQKTFEELAPAVIDKVTRNRATFTRYDIERTLEPAVDSRPERAAMTDAILKRPEVVQLAPEGGRGGRFTTETVLDGERQVARAASTLNDRTNHGLPAAYVSASLTYPSDEANRALAHITSSAGLSILDGQAGTGKSMVLAAGKEMYEANGYRVIGLAHTNLVAQDLRDKGFSAARTIDSELIALDNRRTTWNARTVVMVDEAAMVDTRRLGLILGHAQTCGAKVVLAGDGRQLSSIERGGMFDVLAQRHGAATLTEVHRQQSSDERHASQSMAAGNFTEALGIYGDKNAIQWHDEQSESAEALVKAYMSDYAANPAKTRFIFAYTNQEVDQINAVVRDARQTRGELGNTTTFETKRGQTEVAVGDRLQFTGTDKWRGIYNGCAGTVREINGQSLTVELDGRGKKTVEFDATAFNDFRHGYAGTIYRGQGKTIDQTYLLHSEYWRNASSYVALTRHSEKTQLFVAREIADSLPELAEQMSRRDERRAALAFSAVHEHTATKSVEPDRVAAWYANVKDYSRNVNSDRNVRRRREGANETGPDAHIPREVRVGQMGNSADLKVDGVRSAFAEIARKRRDEQSESSLQASPSYEAARKRWRIGRDGRQR
jgi:Ti-type conjugative transfer relaxase TraA